MLRPRLPSADVQDSKSAQRFRSGSIVFRPAGCSPSTTLHLPIQKSNCRYSTESQVGAGAEGAVLASSAIAPRFQKSAADAVSVAYQFDEHGIFVSQAIVPHHTRILGGGREKNNTVEESLATQSLQRQHRGARHRRLTEGAYSPVVNSFKE